MHFWIKIVSMGPTTDVYKTRAKISPTTTQHRVVCDIILRHGSPMMTCPAQGWSYVEVNLWPWFGYLYCWQMTMKLWGKLINLQMPLFREHNHLSLIKNFQKRNTRIRFPPLPNPCKPNCRTSDAHPKDLEKQLNSII